jgi:cobalt-zinc-cadmium efflux system outer membrane protein
MKPILYCVAFMVGLIACNCFAAVSNSSLDANDANTPRRLDDYLRYAASNNAGLKAAYEEWRAAVEQVPQAKSLPDPQLTYGYATEPTPQRKMFDAMQMFPWFGTIEARADVASAAAKAAFKQFEAKKLELFYEVKQAFYQYCYLAKAINITNESLQLISRFEQVARARYATGTATHPDIIRAQIELAMMENQVKTLEELRPAIVARLNSVLNRPTTNDLPWPQAPDYEQIFIDSGQWFDFAHHPELVEGLQTIVAENNPQLQALGYDIEAARGNENLAKKKFYPDIGVGLGVDSGMGEDGEDRVMARVSLTLPIWTDNYKAAQRQTRAQLNKAAQEKIQLKNTLAARVRQVLYECQNSDREIRLYRDIVIPKASEVVAASLTAYQAGTIDFLSLIDAQRSLLQYRLDYEKAVAENAQRLAELEMLAGMQLPMIKKEMKEK